MEGDSVADEIWWEAHSSAAVPYLLLLRLFIEHRINGDEYELLFLRLYKDDPAAWPEKEFQVLDGLFSDADQFTSDAALRTAVDGLDEAALRVRAHAAFDRLSALSAREAHDRIVNSVVVNSPLRY